MPPIPTSHPCNNPPSTRRTTAVVDERAPFSATASSSFKKRNTKKRQREFCICAKNNGTRSNVFGQENDNMMDLEQPGESGGGMGLTASDGGSSSSSGLGASAEEGDGGSGATRPPSMACMRQLIGEEFLKLEEFTQKQNERCRQQGWMLFSVAMQRCNYHKNRYSNVLALDHSRVKLQGYQDFYLDSDYINASYINGEIPGSEKAYICCQAPLATTIAHFWLMVWENLTPVIVMLTRLVERDRQKAVIYWPENVGGCKRYGNIVIKHKKTKVFGAFLEMRTFELERDGEKRQIVQFHYTEWPDFGVPSSTKTIRDLVCLMDLYKMKGKTAGLAGPVAVHCSAGIGRAGTFIAIHVCVEKMKYYNSLDQINIPQTVMLLRQNRAGMVQTQDQYEFIYEVVRDVRRELSERAQRVFAAPGSVSELKKPLAVKRPHHRNALRATTTNLAHPMMDAGASHAARSASFAPVPPAALPAQTQYSPFCSPPSSPSDIEQESSLAPSSSPQALFLEKKRRLSFSCSS